MTEKEAKQKWCPMVRVAVAPAGDVIDNRFFNGTYTHCLASECAWWSWNDKNPFKKEDWKGYCRGSK